MKTLKLTDKEWKALLDSLQANEEAHCQREEEYDPDEDLDGCTKDLIDGFNSLWKKVWGKPFE
jgi:hypothetical protein